MKLNSLTTENYFVPSFQPINKHYCGHVRMFHIHNYQRYLVEIVLYPIVILFHIRRSVLVFILYHAVGYAPSTWLNVEYLRVQEKFVSKATLYQRTLTLGKYFSLFENRFKPKLLYCGTYRFVCDHWEFISRKQQ